MRQWKGAIAKLNAQSPPGMRTSSCTCTYIEVDTRSRRLPIERSVIEMMQIITVGLNTETLISRATFFIRFHRQKFRSAVVWKSKFLPRCTPRLHTLTKRRRSISRERIFSSRRMNRFSLIRHRFYSLSNASFKLFYLQREKYRKRAHLQTDRCNDKSRHAPCECAESRINASQGETTKHRKN